MEDKNQNGDAIKQPLDVNGANIDVSKGTNVDGVTDVETTVMLETDRKKYLYYGVRENPPLHVAIICGIQHSLMSLTGQFVVSLLVAEAVCAANNEVFKSRLLSSSWLSTHSLMSLTGQLVVSLLVAEAVCAANNEVFKSRLLSSSSVMSGITTIASALLGVRLPLLQAASSVYIIPLLMIGDADSEFCVADDKGSVVNATENITSDENMEKILSNVRALQGSLMLVGVIHMLLGLTGLVGWILNFIGPLTIVPTMILIFVFYAKPVLKFVEVSWAISMSTAITAVILFLYLAKYQMPVPVWTPSGGCRIIRYPLHQVFAILIAILINWLLSGLLTYLGVFSDDPLAIDFKARTDARFHVVYDNPWFTLPYPGQYGPVSFNVKAFVAFLIATLLSVIDSIGDYYACARVCRVPVPPKHAVNRGIMVEGICTILSGAVGCGQSQTTYGSNIGAIGVTQVASRIQFVFAGLFFILFGLFGKVSAFFVSIPYPVLGGAIVVMFGIFFGVIISNLQVTNMSSPRNIAILGLSTFVGLLLPTWAMKTPVPVNTGLVQFDKIAAMLLRNPSLTVIILACLLDNTVSGTKEERGIAAWQVEEDASQSLDPELYDEGVEVYEPLCPKSILNSRITKYIPFLPFRRQQNPAKNM